MMSIMLSAMAIWLCGGAVEPPAISQAALMDSLRSLPTKRSAYGSAEHMDGLVKTEELILERLRKMGYAPTTQEVKWALPAKDQSGGADPTPAEPRVWRNIIVDLPGAEIPDQVLIVGAHFDAVKAAPGADDNGTGTAALLEIASVLHGRPMKRSVRLIFFNLEEVGLIGSRAYTSRWMTDHQGVKEGVKPERVIGMISMEMLGYYTDAENSQKSPIKAVPGVFEPPTTGNFIGIVGLQQFQPFSRRLFLELQKAEPELKVGLVDFLPLPAPDLARSDHASFWLIGQPAVMMTDTANFRNPNYHKASDTVETIDAKRFTMVAEGVARATVAIADGEEIPARAEAEKK